MKLSIICVGRMTIPFLNDGCAEFSSRLKRYVPLTVSEIKEHKTGSKQDIQKSIAKEGETLLQKIPKGAFVIALDQKGRHLGSTEFADIMNEHMIQSVPAWALLIGGPYGLSKEIIQRADLVLSLSAMTLTHQMARLILLEQLYRCCTIIRNEPYHH